ncbi:MAG: exosortase [Nitrospirae bacterium]|nr:exosortase [Nitrospirota bacterium]
MAGILRVGILAALVTAVYYPELYSMVLTWADKKEYSHGFLIPFISGYAIWVKRDELRSVPVKPAFAGVFILLAGVLMLVLGYIAFEPFLRQVSLIITISGLIYFLFGKMMYRALVFSVWYLLFMIPLPYVLMNNIAVSLRLIDATVTFKTLNFLGMPIVQDGASLELPHMSLVVADLCTGILSIVAIMAIAVLYAYFTQRNLPSRLALVFLSVPIAVISNMFRLIMTVGLAYFYGQKALSSVVHEFHGTVNFLVTVFLLFVAGKFIRKIDLMVSKRTL